MKKNEKAKRNYEAPGIEQVLVLVEAGFETSGSLDGDHEGGDSSWEDEDY